MRGEGGKNGGGGGRCAVVLLASRSLRSLAALVFCFGFVEKREARHDDSGHADADAAIHAHGAH